MVTRSIFRLLFVVSLTFFFFAQPAFAQRDTDSTLPGSTLEVYGQVRTANARSEVQNVLVRLVKLGGGLVDQMVTDGAGKFRFTRVRPGQYMVSASIPGFTAEPQQIDVSRFTMRSYVQLQLLPDNSTSKVADRTGVVDARVPAEARKEFEKGRAALQDGKAEEAALYLEKAVRLHPVFFEAQSMLATAYMDGQQWIKAEGALERALEIEPKAIATMVSLGEVYRRQKKYADSEKPLQAAVKLDDNFWPAHYTLGRVYMEMNNVVQAARAIGRTIQLKPDFADAHLFAGSIFIRAGLPENALVEYQEYLRLAPLGEFSAQARALVEKLKKSLSEKKK